MTIEADTNNQLRTGHIGLNVSNLDRSKEFYQAVFGFEIISESGDETRRFAFLGQNQEVLLTLWEQSTGRFERNRSGLHHLAFRVAALDGLKDFEQRLQKLNVPLLYEGIVAHLEGAPSCGIFFEDPDGIRLEIFIPNGAQAYPAPATSAPACGFF